MRFCTTHIKGKLNFMKRMRDPGNHEVGQRFRNPVQRSSMYTDDVLIATENRDNGLEDYAFSAQEKEMELWASTLQADKSSQQHRVFTKIMQDPQLHNDGVWFRLAYSEPEFPQPHPYSLSTLRLRHRQILQASKPLLSPYTLPTLLPHPSRLLAGGATTQQ